MSRNKKYRFHVVPHTHWDREWYKTNEEFKFQLSEFFEYLFRIMSRDSKYKYFTLDGQTSMIEDYLEIHPEKRGKIEERGREGRILIGPWYTQMDEFLVSGEAIIRNLILGHRMAEEFGEPMKIGYLLDQFGHISQMPQILRGFNIKYAVVWRGVEKNSERAKTESIWEAPDGSSVMVEYLPQGYSNALEIPSQLEDAKKKLEKIKKELLPFATTSCLLMMNGIDHAYPQENLTQIIEATNKVLKDGELIHSNLLKFFKEIEESNPSLSRVKGEFRAPGFLLYGTLSSRMYLKQENFECQNLLERYAEPLSAIAWIYKMEYPRDKLWRAWRYLMRNHAHDSICGCSTDEVHRDMLYRFSQVRYIGRNIISSAVECIGRQVKAEGDEGQHYIIVFNPLSYDRDELIEVNLDTTKDDGFFIVDYNGKVVPHIVLDRDEKDRAIVDSRNIRRFSRIKEIKIRVFVKDIPALGYKTLRIMHGRRHSNDEDSFRMNRMSMENKRLKVEINPDGSLKISEKSTGEIWNRLNVFEDGADVGDEYNYSPPSIDRIVTSHGERADVSVVEKTTEWGRFKVKLNLNLPRKIKSNRKERMNALADCPITSYITLHSTSKRIDITTVIENRCMDHRLRVLFPSGARDCIYSLAEGQFDIIRRQIKSVKPTPGNCIMEVPPLTHPTQGIIIVKGKTRGLAIATRGLTEYAVKNDGEKTIAMTLLRAVGWLSRDDLHTRKYPAGPFIPTPEAQCLDRYVYHYSIIPIVHDSDENQIWSEGYKYKVPPKCCEIYPSNNGSLPLTMSLVKVSPDYLKITALKKSENEDILILRLFNITKKKSKVRIVFYNNIEKAYKLNLNEEIQKELDIEKNNSVQFETLPKEIVTIGFRLSSNENI